MRRRTRIPAVTLWRPWAACFTDLPELWAKRHENRGWATKHRGLTYFHNGKRFDPDCLGVADEVMGRCGVDPVDLSFLTRRHDHPTGIVAVANLVSVCSDQAASATNGATCDCPAWAYPGQHHWRFGHVVKLPEPVECDGSQRLWEPEPYIDTAVRAQLADLVVCRGCLARVASICCSIHNTYLCHRCYRLRHRDSGDPR